MSEENMSCKAFGYYLESSGTSKQTQTLLRNAIENTLGNSDSNMWQTLMEVEVPQNRKAPLEAVLFVRQKMKQENLLSTEGFAARFPRIAWFDKRTYSKRRSKDLISSVNQRIQSIGGVSEIRSGHYDTDNDPKDGNRFLYPAELKGSDEEWLSSDDIKCRFGCYVPQERAAAYTYYYRNELDHLLTYLLDKCFTGKARGGINDLGLTAMKEAVANEQEEPFPKENWESGINEVTLYKMGFLGAVCGGSLQGSETDTMLGDGFRAGKRAFADHEQLHD